ncbi:Adenosylcobalamin-dependent ribonucleoside-triphosphate reductase [Halomicronema hongdechloris C2206]|uniref:Adenosylcobalamin-dependent ribonucleoside-triphosphate reductase n=1 Tax=Halomicronema hongdechloris C2206 TaxID=1641165 RepID=A0A1Z3HFR2_9CYAN|nr:ribonucleoside-triphosphate reductase, adenosylcobalamin-dependent [Halomicronema hongdechloris]ASC69117.1 Adenosylcobalamin-dependent ribonucleoside-triphosphate reductase [Halomicronema hongdechloris C2206]
MVQERPRIRQSGPFPDNAPTALPVFYRTYSRRDANGPGQRETWEQVCDRTLAGLMELGQFTVAERELLQRMQQTLKALPSGRWLWVGGTAWSKQPENFSGAYNCTSTNVVDWRAFGLMMDLAMMGCGTGAVLESKYINQLPAIRNRLQVTAPDTIGTTPPEQRRDSTDIAIDGNQVTIHVGDSRQGWVLSYQTLLELSSDPRFTGDVYITVDLSDVRPAGEKLKGFGGVANPIRLPKLYERCAKILNQARGRQLNSVECCLLIDEAAACVVAGNIRRCLPEDALVHTAQGLVPIQAIQVGDLVQTPLGFRRVVNTFYQGLQEVYEIETNATLPRATLNHRQAVLASADGAVDWKRLSDLAPGNRLLHTTNVLPGTLTQLPQDFTEQRPDQSRNAKSLTIPLLTPEVAWLIGYTHGDGYVALGRNQYGKPYGQVEWAMNGNVPPQVERLRQKLDAALAHFGLRASHGTVDGENTAKSICSSIRLAEYFHRYVKQPRQSLEVPPFILQGMVDIRAAYLAGLMDSDGAANNRPPHLLTTVYPKFARQVGALLSSLGIAGRLTLVRPHEPTWQVKYNLTLPALKGRYNDLIAPHSVKGALRQGLKMYGFTLPGAMMWQTYTYSQMREMGFQGNRTVDANYERYITKAEVDLDIPITVKGLGSYDVVPTYDIEVEEAHCFYCDGYLTHNSAGMRQFASDDELAATAKDNLWQQDANGNWRIDPERDVLRMANHTRVFHRKPTLEECTNAVRKQFYSGEGAIQWAGEAERRAQGEGRYGLNPCGEIVGQDFHCVSGDTLLITRDGLHPIGSLVGQSVEIWNGRRWSRVQPLQTGRDRQLYRVSFGDGTWLDVTDQHRFFVKDRFGKTYTEMTTAELRESLAHGKYALHTEPFTIDYQEGQFVDPVWAYTLGQLVGDGSLCQSNSRPQLQLRLYGEKSYRSLALAGRTSGKVRYYAENPETPCLLYAGSHHDFDPAQVRQLKYDPSALEAIAQWNRDAILHFVAGLIDADGSATGTGGVRLYLSDYDRAYRVYLLLLKCGIRSSINLMAKAGEQTNLGQRLHDLWYLQITDCQAIPCQRVDTTNGHAPKTKGKWQVIRSVEPLASHHDTFCFNEPELHKGVFGGTLTGQCNLAEIHLNQLDPENANEQEEAFTAGALAVAALLNHQFVEPRYQKSRLEDPIVGVSFTGLFDFFVHAFGIDWLRWWQAGRPDTIQGLDFKEQEASYLRRWKDIVHQTVWDYCDRHGLTRPNRCTTVQPAGTKSLLTGASPGWHPPKAQRFIRRITFRKNDPVAMACIDYGYAVVPSQSDKDEQGNLLNDPFDPRCTEWLVELPVAVSWADLPGADEIAIEQFSALAQFDFYMQVQKHYTTHNTSATIELREPEIEPLSQRIHAAINQDEGYISAALLARFDNLQTFPRLPFEPIGKVAYDRLVADVLARRATDDFYQALARYDAGDLFEAGPAGCDSDKCMLPEEKPS